MYTHQQDHQTERNIKGEQQIEKKGWDGDYRHHQNGHSPKSHEHIGLFREERKATDYLRRL